MLRKWIVTAFSSRRGVTLLEAESDMDAIWSSYAMAARVSPYDMPEDEIARLKILFDEEWAGADVAGHAGHSKFVKDLAERIAKRAAMR